VCVDASTNGACLADVEGEVSMTSQGVGAIDLGADPWRWLHTCQGVGAIDLGADPLYPAPVRESSPFFLLCHRRAPVSPRRPGPHAPRPGDPPPAPRPSRRPLHARSTPPAPHVLSPLFDAGPSPPAHLHASSSSNPAPGRLGIFLSILVIVLAFLLDMLDFLL
jgi:hypothetical protein